MAVVEVSTPDIGDFESVEIIEILVQPGDTIRAEQSLVTVESDKASMEIPASRGGVVKELKVKLGDKISRGTVLLSLEAAGGGEAGGEAAAERPPARDAAGPADARAAAPTRPTADAQRAPPPSLSQPATAAPPAPAGAPIEVRVPDIGDFDEVGVIELLVQVGDTVAVDQSLVTVESDKSSMEIPSSGAGTVTELRVAVGDKVSAGSVLVLLAAGAAASAPAPGAGRTTTPSPGASPAPSPAARPAGPSEEQDPQASALPERTPPTAALPPPPVTAASGPLPHASPSIRKLARELGVPLSQLPGSGPKGRITHDDVHGYVQGVMAGKVAAPGGAAAAAAATPAAGHSGANSGNAGALAGLLPWPQVDFGKFGPVERVERSRIQKLSAANLHRNWVLIPHVTNHDDADITELEALRVQLNRENEKSGVKVTMLAFIIKACVAALRQFPDFNASLDGEQLVRKGYVHIGFAADTPNGLVVPVIRDADKKGVLQLSTELGELAKKARDGKLSGADMSGGCFSISSLGGIGGRYFTPIINAPEVAILGVGRSLTEPVWDGHAFQPRLRLPLSLSYDHRVIDGAAAARFNAFLCRLLADFRRAVL